MKKTFIALSIFCFATQLNAAEQAAPLSISTQATFGLYGGSAEREGLHSESVTLDYSKDPFGGAVTLRNWELFRKAPLGDLSGFDTNLSFYLRQKIGANGFVGGVADVTYLTGNDSNIDQTFVPFGAITCKTPSGEQYFDLGYASMGYKDTTANQLTTTFGTALFNRYIWSQTRLYYNNLTAEVQGKGHTVSVEERLTWYVVPSKFSLTFSGMIGQRVYGYDPDLKIAYSMPDIQKESGGLTGTWQITPAFTVFGDVTFQTFEKRTISNSYNATYGTLGLTYKF